MARTSSFGAANRLSQSDVNKRATEVSERLGEMHKPEPKQRQNRSMHRPRPAAEPAPKADEGA